MSANTIFKRAFFAIVILFLLIPAFVLNFYAGLSGRIIGSIIFNVIGMVGLYEILKIMKISWYISLLTSAVVPLFFLLDYNSIFKILYVNGNMDLSLSTLMSWGAFSWHQWVVLLIFTFLPGLLSFNFRKISKINYFFIPVVVCIISLFTKVVWLINIFDINLVFYFLSIAVIADTMGYFGGMMFGKKWLAKYKFAPKISPKKTWAGFIFGWIFSAIFAVIGGYFLNAWSDYGSHEVLVSILFGLFLSTISPLGDLLFSLIKRVNRTKDFSNLIPGHGGIFDRLDAISFVVATASIFLYIATF